MVALAWLRGQLREFFNYLKNVTIKYRGWLLVFTKWYRYFIHVLCLFYLYQLVQVQNSFLELLIFHTKFVWDTRILKRTRGKNDVIFSITFVDLFFFSLLNLSFFVQILFFQALEVSVIRQNLVPVVVPTRKPVLYLCKKPYHPLNPNLPLLTHRGLHSIFHLEFFLLPL